MREVGGYFILSVSVYLSVPVCNTLRRIQFILFLFSKTHICTIFKLMHFKLKETTPPRSQVPLFNYLTAEHHVLRHGSVKGTENIREKVLARKDGKKWSWYKPEDAIRLPSTRRVEIWCQSWKPRSIKASF